MSQTEVQLESDVVTGTDAVDTADIVNAGTNKLRIKAVYILPKTAVSTHASNYITTTLANGGTTVAAHTTNSSGGSALVARTLKTVTISGTGTALELAAGGTLTVDVSKAGTGPAYKHRVIVVGEVIRS